MNFIRCLYSGHFYNNIELIINNNTNKSEITIEFTFMNVQEFLVKGNLNEKLSEIYQRFKVIQFLE